MTKEEDAEENIVCYECKGELDIRTKVKALRKNGFEWICGGCYTKEILGSGKITDTKDTSDNKNIPFYEKGPLGKIKRYFWDDTINDLSKIAGKDNKKKGE